MECPLARLRLGAIPLLLMTLAACAAPDGRRTVPVQTEPAGASGAAPAPRSAVAAVNPAVATILDGSPARILGLDRGAVARMLGAPALIRRDPPAEVWQYHGTGCVLDLFLYDGPGGAHRVTHAEARNAAAEPTATERCIAGLLAGRQRDRGAG